jgi:hypothetical protein
VNRQKTAEGLQQLLVLTTSLNEAAISRRGSNLHLEFGEVSPYLLFTSILNSLGEDPLSPLLKIQDMINAWKRLFHVSVITISVNAKKVNYRKIPIPSLIQSWLDLGQKPEDILPQFDGVQWNLVR